MPATEVWDYDAGQTIFSAFCSSAYEAADQSILVDYAVASKGTEALLVGLDSSHNVAFEFKISELGGMQYKLECTSDPTGRSKGQ